MQPPIGEPMTNNRPDRPWKYWYEIRIEYISLFRIRPKKWWRDMFSLPYHTWVIQRAYRALFELVSPEDFRKVLREVDERRPTPRQ